MFWRMKWRRFLPLVGTLHSSFLLTLIPGRKQFCNYKCFILKCLEIKRVENTYCNRGLAPLVNYSSKSCCFKFAIIWQDTASRRVLERRVTNACLYLLSVCIQPAGERFFYQHHYFEAFFSLSQVPGGFVSPQGGGMQPWWQSIVMEVSIFTLLSNICIKCLALLQTSVSWAVVLVIRLLLLLTAHV